MAFFILWFCIRLPLNFFCDILNVNQADVAEWLRRLTRNQFPSGSVGSNRIPRKTHLVPGSLFVSLPVSQTVFSLIVLSVIVLL